MTSAAVVRLVARRQWADGLWHPTQQESSSRVSGRHLSSRGLFTLVRHQNDA
jgi:hypothetical protein